MRAEHPPIPTNTLKAPIKREQKIFGFRFSDFGFRLLAIITAILVAAAAYTSFHFRKSTPSGPSALVPIPQRKTIALDLPTLDHKTWALHDHLGKIVLINYFATWCPPCRNELPDLVKLHADFQSQGLDIALISIDKDTDANRPRTETLTDFNAFQKLPFPILLPPTDSPLLHNEFPIPQTLLLDRQGKIALHLVGQLDPETFTPLLKKLLQEKP